MKKYLLLLIIPILYFVPKLKGAPDEAVKMLNGLDSIATAIDTRKLDSLERSIIGSDSTITKTIMKVSTTITGLRSTIVGLNKKVKLLENEVQTLRKENEGLKKQLDSIATDNGEHFHFFTRKSKNTQ